MKKGKQIVDKPDCACALQTPVETAPEMTARHFLDRLVSALKTPCGDALNLQILVWERAIYVNTHCQDGCSSRERSGQGQSVYDAFVALMETCERQKRLETLKAQIAQADAHRPLNATELSEREQALVRYGVEIGQSLPPSAR